MSSPFKIYEAPADPAPQKDSYWRQRAAQAWPGMEICGDGQFVFCSKCENKVSLFATAAEARAKTCWAGENCDPLRSHQRVKFIWYPPVKNWQDDD